MDKHSNNITEHGIVMQFALDPQSHAHPYLAQQIAKLPQCDTEKVGSSERSSVREN